MRLLAIICGVLLLANLAVFLWPQASINAKAYSERKEINAHLIRLNQEIEQQNTQKPTENRRLTQSGDELVCYRIGPFMQQTNYELAQAVLFNVNVDFQTNQRASDQADVYRVYLGNFADKENLRAARQSLRDNEVLDHFTRKLPNGEFMISLGIYTTEQTANAAFSEMKSKLNGVKLQQETLVLPDSYWLHFSLNNNNPTLEQLRLLDWGEKSAKLGEFACQTNQA